MKLSRNHVDFIAFLVYKRLKEHPRVEVLNADAVVNITRGKILENLQAEAELEREAEQLLQNHRADILQQGADYRRMVREGARTLARKRGIVI